MNVEIDTQNSRYGLSGNALKIVAAISMLIDHIGVVFFPYDGIYRIVGRIALPIFAFMIAEGCRYTKNKLRYFATVFGLATACQTVYFIYDGDTYMSILVTFSLSILVIYALQFFKESFFDREADLLKKVLSGVLFVFSIAAVYFLNTVLEIDYGFFGCMLPVFAALLHPIKNAKAEWFVKLDKIPLHVLSLGVGMLLLALSLGSRQYWSFIALIPLFMYSGKRGKMKMKYFFYIFYPLHLLLLECINMIL